MLIMMVMVRPLLLLYCIVTLLWEKQITNLIVTMATLPFIPWLLNFVISMT